MHLLDTHLANTVVRHFPSHQHWIPSRSHTPSSDILDGVASSFNHKMELGNILNTKMPSKALAGNSLLYDMNHTMQHELQAHNQAAYPPPYLNGRIKSETNSERAVSPHPSDNRYQPQPQQLSYSAMSNGYDQMRYPSPSAGSMGVQNQLLAYNQSQQAADAYAQQAASTPPANGRQQGDSGPPKAFACSTCGKGFARRSDLARHGKQSFSMIHVTRILLANTR
jgi:hypothetical protein